MNRTTPRDLFDVSVAIKDGLIRKTDLFRKIAVFYGCISDGSFNINKIERINLLYAQGIKEGLVPLIRKKESFDLQLEKEAARSFLTDLFTLDKNDKEFINAFKNGRYTPDILFEGIIGIQKDIGNHPMALWKMLNMQHQI